MIYLAGNNVWYLDWQADGWSYLNPVIDGVVYFAGVKVCSQLLAGLPSMSLAEWLAGQVAEWLAGQVAE